MATSRVVHFCVGVITLGAVLTISAGNDVSTELSFTHTTISELPHVSLYAINQSQLSDKIKSETSTTSKDARPFHLEEKIYNAKSENDSLGGTVSPSSAYIAKKLKKDGDDIDIDLDDSRNEQVGMPVALAQTASNKGYTRSDGTYIVKDDEDTACVMAFFKCHATIYYSDSKGDYQSKVISPAENSEVFGTCDRIGQQSSVSVKWASFTLTLRFGLEDITDSWFVSQFSLTYNLSESMFPDSAPGSSVVTVSSSKDRKFWQTNNAYSFRCLLLHDIAMRDELNNTATLHFDEVRVQAFCIYNVFRRPKHCIHRVHRDEMVPVTVGATLAGSTLLTIAAYGVFRYFKVKKVQYDTME